MVICHSYVRYYRRVICGSKCNSKILGGDRSDEMQLVHRTCGSQKGFQEGHRRRLFYLSALRFGFGQCHKPIHKFNLCIYVHIYIYIYIYDTFTIIYMTDNHILRSGSRPSLAQYSCLIQRFQVTLQKLQGSKDPRLQGSGQFWWWRSHFWFLPVTTVQTLLRHPLNGSEWIWMAD